MDPIAIFDVFYEMLGSQVMVGISLLLAVVMTVRASRFKGQRDMEYQKRCDAEAGEDDARSDNRALVAEINAQGAEIQTLRKEVIDLKAGIVVPARSDAPVFFMGGQPIE